DYAHTPDAVEKVLRTLRPLTRGRLIALFGCGGDRDRAKRPLMAEAVARFADRLIATSDNPRTEDPLALLAAVQRGPARPQPPARRSGAPAPRRRTPPPRVGRGPRTAAPRSSSRSASPGRATPSCSPARATRTTRSSGASASRSATATRRAARSRAGPCRERAA